MMDEHVIGANTFANLKRNGLTIAVKIRNGQLDLPWENHYWNIKVTHVEAADAIWATVDSNADLLRRTAKTIDVSALIPADDIARNAIYIWKSAATATTPAAPAAVHRVKVIDWASGDDGRRRCCDCFFIDTGKFARITADQLYRCTDNMERIAPQAICFRPNGIDELNNCPHINNPLTRCLLDKPLAACIMMTQHDYHSQLARAVRTPKIAVTLFERKGLQLLRPRLFRQIGELLPAAAIDAAATTVANVSHISSAGGLVYVQPDRPSIDYIRTLIEATVRNKQVAECELHRLRYPKGVVLAYDGRRKVHVRAKIVGHHVTAALQSAYKCFYIDYGEVRLTEPAQIRAINETSFLHHIPSQAVPAKLDLLVDMDAVTVQRLRAMFRSNGAVRIEAVNHRSRHVPNVTVYRQSSQSPLNINRLIYMEIQLRHSTALLPDGDF